MNQWWDGRVFQCILKSPRRKEVFLIRRVERCVFAVVRCAIDLVSLDFKQNVENLLWSIMIK